MSLKILTLTRRHVPLHARKRSEDGVMPIRLQLKLKLLSHSLEIRLLNFMLRDVNTARRVGTR